MSPGTRMLPWHRQPQGRTSDIVLPKKHIKNIYHRSNNYSPHTPWELVWSEQLTHSHSHARSNVMLPEAFWSFTCWLTDSGSCQDLELKLYLTLCLVGSLEGALTPSCKVSKVNCHKQSGGCWTKKQELVLGVEANMVHLNRLVVSLLWHADWNQRLKPVHRKEEWEAPNELDKERSSDGKLYLWRGLSERVGPQKETILQ